MFLEVGKTYRIHGKGSALRVEEYWRAFRGNVNDYYGVKVTDENGEKKDHYGTSECFEKLWEPVDIEEKPFLILEGQYYKNRIGDILKVVKARITVGNYWEVIFRRESNGAKFTMTKEYEFFKKKFEYIGKTLGEFTERPNPFETPVQTMEKITIPRERNDSFEKPVIKKFDSFVNEALEQLGEINVNGIVDSFLDKRDFEGLQKFLDGRK